MFTGNIEDPLRPGRFEQLIKSIEFLGFGKMTQIAGVKNECRRSRQGVDLVNGCFKRGKNILVGFFAETDVAVTDLHEAQVPRRHMLLKISGTSQRLRA